MIINIAPAAGGLLLKSAAGRNINFATDDRFDSFLPGGFEKIDGTIQHTVIGDRQRGETQIASLVHQPIEAAGAVEQRILGVQMKMNEVSVRHRTNLAASKRVVQGESQEVIHRRTV